jgi:hypothetical protein
MHIRVPAIDRPNYLLVVDVVSDNLHQSSICFLCLSICLRVVACRHFQPRLRESEEFFPELTNKPSIRIGYYFLRQTKPPIPMVEEHLRCCHCVHIGSGRDEHHQIGEFVHNYHHRVMIRFCLGKGGDKVHTHLFETYGRNLQRLEQTNWFLVGCLIPLPGVAGSDICFQLAIHFRPSNTLS